MPHCGLATSHTSHLLHRARVLALAVPVHPQSPRIDSRYNLSVGNASVKGALK